MHAIPARLIRVLPHRVSACSGGDGRRGFLHPSFLLLLAGMVVLASRARSDPGPYATTDPRAKDSDGDGYADGPDFWLELPDGKGGTLAYLFRGEDFNGNGKHEPWGTDGDPDTRDDESDPTDPGSIPSWDPVLLDSDRDGLPDRYEAENPPTDPHDMDSDDDGLTDGEETYGLGRAYVDGVRIYTDPLNPDTDLDGLPDGLELGVAEPIPGHTDSACTFVNDQTFHVERRCFISDADRGDASTRTDPRDWDTNHDGILDGEHDRNSNGALDRAAIDGTEGDGEDESDAVVGLRWGGCPASYDRGGDTYFIETSDVFHASFPSDIRSDAPPDELRFYWGSSPATSVKFIVEPQEASGLLSFYGDGIPAGPSGVVKRGKNPYAVVRISASGRLPEIVSFSWTLGTEASNSSWRIR